MLTKLITTLFYIIKLITTLICVNIFNFSTYIYTKNIKQNWFYSNNNDIKRKQQHAVIKQQN